MQPSPWDICLHSFQEIIFLSDWSRLLYPLTGRVPNLGSQRSWVWGTCLKLVMGGLVTLPSARLVSFQRSEAGCSVALKQLILSSADDGVWTSRGQQYPVKDGGCHLWDRKEEGT